jgi:hypothetical protein
MSQMVINPIFPAAAIAASPSGLSRTGNVVTVTLTANPPIPLTVETTNGSGFITSLGMTVIIAGSLAVNGNDFNGSFPITAVYPSAGLAANQFQYMQVGPNDTGGGGTATVTPCTFTDIPDQQLLGNQPLTDVAMQAISHNAKFGIVARETLTLGFYTSGNYMPTVVSPVDGYIYSMAELIFKPDLKSSRQPGAGFVPGQLTFPVLANSDLGAGALISVPYQLYIDTTSGVLICQIYFAGNGGSIPGGPYNQGTVLVTATGQRGSVNI